MFLRIPATPLLPNLCYNHLFYPSFFLNNFCPFQIANTIETIRGQIQIIHSSNSKVRCQTSNYKSSQRKPLSRLNVNGKTIAGCENVNGISYLSIRLFSRCRLFKISSNFCRFEMAELSLLRNPMIRKVLFLVFFVN
jgi:hypothetical protein